MIERSMVIGLESGLEARPIAILVQVASKYESSLYIVSGEKKVNAKSIMGMMGIGLASGESVTLIADGSDEAEAVAEIEKYLRA